MEFFRLRTITSQLVTMITLPVLLAFTIANIMGHLIITDDLSKSTKAHHLQTAESLARNVSSYIENAYNIAQEISLMDEVQNLDRDKQRQILWDINRRYPFFDVLYIQETGGSMQMARSHGTYVDRSQRWWFQRMLADNRSFVAKTTYTLFGNGDYTVTPIFFPIYTANRYTAILGADLKLDVFQEYIEKMYAGQGGQVYILDGEGAVVAHPDKVQMEELYNYRSYTRSVIKKDRQGKIITENGNQVIERFPIQVPEKLKEITAKALQGETGVEEYKDLAGQEIVSAYCPVKLPGASDNWAVITVQKRSEALAAVDSVTQKNHGIIVGVAVLLTGLIMYLARRITKPILSIEQAVKEMAGGNLQVHLQSSNNSVEVRSLVQNVNKMAASMRDLINGLAAARQETESKHQALLEETVQRGQAEAALRMSEEKFRKAFRHCGDVIGIVRLADRSCIDVNDNFYKTFGYEPERVTDKVLMEAGLWGDITEYWAIYRELTEKGLAYRPELVWCTADGKEKTGTYSVEVITIAQEPCALFVWHDITERIAAERVLRQANENLEKMVSLRTSELMAMNEELQAMNSELERLVAQLQSTQAQLVQSEKMAALGSLVSGIAHEMNTPLGNGITLTSHLQERLQEVEAIFVKAALKRAELAEYFAESSEGLEVLARNLAYAAELVMKFKHVSALPAADENKMDFNVCECVQAALIICKEDIPENSHTIVIDCDETLLLHGQAWYFTQVVVNLLQNSARHAYGPKETGQIIISVHRSETGIVFTYADDGCGIQTAHQDKIFDPFFTTKRSGGIGLGLYNVYNIITGRFGGSIECCSEAGVGTRFIIRLPVTPSNV